MSPPFLAPSTSDFGRPEARTNNHRSVRRLAPCRVSASADRGYFTISPTARRDPRTIGISDIRTHPVVPGVRRALRMLATRRIGRPSTTRPGAWRRAGRARPRIGQTSKSPIARCGPRTIGITDIWTHPVVPGVRRALRTLAARNPGQPPMPPGRAPSAASDERDRGS
jgi:hypothetical protein